MSNIIDKIQLSGVTYDIGGQGGSGVSVVEVTQAEYDALPTSAKTDTSKMYVITDAEAGDLTNYYTKTETNTLLGGKADTATTYTKTEVDNAITAATATKQDTLVSGTNIKTINNTSILGSGNIDIQGGGGKAIEAGRGISVTTGETADTVSFNLPISAGTGVDSIKEGDRTTASGDYSHTEGGYSTANGNYSHAEGMATITYGMSSHAEGYVTEARNKYEHASGAYNVSSSATTEFGHSGNTLFSVGNGTSSSAKHNAFEIRQNGDIYISSGGTDIKLQDHLGGGGGEGISSAECQTMIDNSISGKADSDDVYTTGQTSGATELATAFAATQPKLSAGTGISIDANNVISATGGGGGGKAIEAGRGISVTTGETADTVSFNLPISADSNTYINVGVGNTNNNTELNILIGSGNTAYNGNVNTVSGGTAIGFGNEVGYIGRANYSKSYSFAFGYYNKIQGGHSYAIGDNNNIGRGISNAKDRSFLIGYYNTCTFDGDSSDNYIFGKYCTVTKSDEFALGKYNASSNNGTTSGNTFFSIGNGTSSSARHNAFEIRQNGDIYCSDGTNDVKLQDTITATAANTTALGGLSLVKLTQAQYDALATKDSNTLYVING